MSRKQARLASWLAAVQDATAAYCGQAHVTGDRAVPAAETSFRGAGYRLSARIVPERTIFGPLPEGAWEAHGETARPPDARLDPASGFFPPDSLRSLPYWECARSGVEQQVLVVMASQPLVRLLNGSEDDLPDAVCLIHRWTRLPPAEREVAMRGDLAQPGHSPVAYVAGFELLAEGGAACEASFAEIEGLPGRPGAAVAGMLAELQRMAMGLPQARELVALLLRTWAEESDPEALAAYLLWFSALRPNWERDRELAQGVLAQARRASGLSFGGAHGQEWEQQVRYYAEDLLSQSR